MTEYDWSPEAWERHLESQQRVNNWVVDQTARIPQQQWTKHSAGSVAPSYTTHSSHHSSSHSRHRSRSSSMTASTPTKARPGMDHQRSVTEPMHEAYARSRRSSQSRQSSQPPSRSYKPATYVSQYPQTSSRGGYYRDASGHRYQAYDYDASTGQIVLPPPRAGEQYIITPPANRPLVVVNNDPYTTVRHSSRSSSHTSSSKNQPLLKRLFSGLSPTRSSASSHTAKLTRHSSRDGRY
ncbi:hypothetical protein PsYK624_014990 [Phanerochaete sordida]|uniref:Uncharacterized protein n=1 Tax=Phanerochaete sordida TaxID=48140 RepID=A0A9P3L7W4_9APHY|nr:hypothetical protein PsYK624_014990 [Phanerochaete sordida]